MTPKPKTRKAPKTSAATKAAPRATPVTKTKPAAVTAPAAKTTAKAGTKPTAAKAKPAVSKPVEKALQVTFNLFAPEAGTVLVAGDFTKWETSPISLVKDASGNWQTTVALKPGRYEYRLLVDGQWQNDPACPDLEANDFGSANCVLSVAA